MKDVCLPRHNLNNYLSDSHWTQPRNTARSQPANARPDSGPHLVVSWVAMQRMGSVAARRSRAAATPVGVSRERRRHLFDSASAVVCSELRRIGALAPVGRTDAMKVAVRGTLRTTPVTLQGGVRLVDLHSQRATDVDRVPEIRTASRGRVRSAVRHGSRCDRGTDRWQLSAERLIR